MDPVAFRIFGIEIMWYGVLISLGVLLGVFAALKECRKIGFDENNLLDFLIIAIPCGIIGARAYYVIFSWDYYSHNLSEIINIRNGGLAIHGGLIVGVIVGWLFCRKRKIKILQLLDIIVPSVSLGQSIGRWGNFINQEAYGRPTNLPWAIVVDGQKVHPTFLYESIIDFALFIFLTWFMRKKKLTDGQVFSLYLILYSIGRFFVEGLRTDSLIFLGMRVAQLVSLGSIIAGVVLWIYLKKKEA